MAVLRTLAVWNGNWVTPDGDITAASSVVKQALDLFAQPGSGLTLFGRVVVMPGFPANAIAGHHEVLASANQIE